jgi:putative glutathione S-transferase
VRLYVTLVRFDTAYHTLFRCNIRSIRADYPRLHAWLRRLYWDEGADTNGGAFKHTTYFEAFKKGYAGLRDPVIVPAGPLPNMIPLDA